MPTPERSHGSPCEQDGEHHNSRIYWSGRNYEFEYSDYTRHEMPQPSPESLELYGNIGEPPTVKNSSGLDDERNDPNVSLDYSAEWQNRTRDIDSVRYWLENASDSYCSKGSND